MLILLRREVKEFRKGVYKIYSLTRKDMMSQLDLLLLCSNLN